MGTWVSWLLSFDIAFRDIVRREILPNAIQCHSSDRPDVGPSPSS